MIWTTLCLGGYRAETMVVTSALTCSLLAVHFAERAAMGKTLPALHPAGWLPLPFLVYAAANVIAVSPVRWLGWLDWLGWANVLAVFWVGLNGLRSAAPRRALWLALVTLGVAAVAMACYQRFVRPGWLMLGREQAAQFFGRASGPFGIPNSLAAFLLLLLPASGALALRRGASAVARVWWIWVTLGFALGLLLSLSRGAWIALALALAAWPLGKRRWAWRKRAGLAAVALAVAATVGAGVYAASPKARARFASLLHHAGESSRPILWRAAWKLFLEHPAAGSGAGSFNPLFERHRPGRFVDNPQWAHNDYLNTLSDYGAIGFGLLAFGAGGAAFAIRSRNRGCGAEADSLMKAERLDPGPPIAGPAVGPALVAASQSPDARQSGLPISGSPTGRLGVKPCHPGRTSGNWLEAPATRGALGIGALAFALQLFVDFHFRIPALGMAFAVTAALAARPVAVSRERRDRARTAVPGARKLAAFGAVAMALAFAAAAIPVVRIYRAEALRVRAREAIDVHIAHSRPVGEWPALLGRAEADLRRATALNPANAAAWADRALAQEMQIFANPGRVGELAAGAEQAARRALELAAVVPEFWIRLGVALDLQGRGAEAHDAYRRSLALAPNHAHGWYYYAAHLARGADGEAREAARRAVGTCLSLDPGNAAAEALRQKLNERR